MQEISQETVEELKSIPPNTLKEVKEDAPDHPMQAAKMIQVIADLNDLVLHTANKMAAEKESFKCSQCKEALIRKTTYFVVMADPNSGTFWFQPILNVCGPCIKVRTKVTNGRATLSE